MGKCNNTTTKFGPTLTVPEKLMDGGRYTVKMKNQFRLVAFVNDVFGESNGVINLKYHGIIKSVWLRIKAWWQEKPMEEIVSQ